MRDHTNLAWPEGPFGADQRPFGKRQRILMAIAIELDDRGADAVPVAAATVYLRTHRTQVMEVRADTLNIGFRATAAEDPGDEASLLDLVDRALVRGRRHATVLAGHDLGRDLARLRRPGHRRLPGVTGVAEAWGDRKAGQRGMAAMIDTQEDVEDDGVLVDTTLQPVPRAVRCGELDLLAASSLVRCIAIGLVAARRVGVYRWEGCFAARHAAENAAWDRMERVDWAGLSLLSG
jgi:hypothetical protein